MFATVQYLRNASVYAGIQLFILCQSCWHWQGLFLYFPYYAVYLLHIRPWPGWTLTLHYLKPTMTTALLCCRNMLRPAATFCRLRQQHSRCATRLISTSPMMLDSERYKQISEEIAKLLELKAQLGDEGSKKFVLKTPKVKNVLCHCKLIECEGVENWRKSDTKCLFEFRERETTIRSKWRFGNKYSRRW